MKYFVLIKVKFMLYSNIKQVRDSLNLTQEELAIKLGVSSRTIQNWESGGTIPKTKIRAIGDLIRSCDQSLIRLIGKIDGGGKATQGDNSPIYESGETKESVTVDIKLPADLEESHAVIKRLMRKLDEKEKEYAKLEGKYEELDRLFRDVLRSKT